MTELAQRFSQCTTIKYHLSPAALRRDWELQEATVARVGADEDSSTISTHVRVNELPICSPAFIHLFIYFRMLPPSQWQL